MRRLLRWIGLTMVAAAIVLAAAFAWDMRQAYARIRGGSSVVASPYGQIEYTTGGSGPPVLVIHGSGGGFDQGELIVRAVLGDGFRWVAPSRFGYLRSTFQPGATFDDQAHAYAALLDHLGIERTAVVALSHGGPSALLFAALHPDRVSSLALVSCGVASSAEADQAQANAKGDMLMRIFQHDLLYWAVAKLFKGQLMTLMGANDALSTSLTPEQRALIDAVIDGMNPVAPRAAGTVFDNQAAMPNERIAAIRVPTIIFHATDDTLQLYRNAEYAAATIPGAQLVSFPRGGHLILSVEQAAIRAALQSHILAHAGGSAGTE